MKNIKKAIGMAMLLMCSASTAFAAVPTSTLLIGNKAYDLDYANDIKNRKEILETMKECGEVDIYIKLNNVWLDNMTKKKIPAELIPMLEYKDKDGVVTKYAAQDGDPIEEGTEEGNKEDNKEENNGGNTGGGSTPGGTVSKENFKILSGYVYLDNGNKIYANDTEDILPKYDYYEVNVSQMGEAQLLGLEVEFPKNIKKFKAYMPASDSETLLERDIVNGKVKIDCKDPEFADKDSGKPGVSLAALQEKAGSFSLNKDFIDINVELVDDNGNSQTAKIILRVK